MSNKFSTWLVLGGVALLIGYMLMQKTPAEKRQALIAWGSQDPGGGAATAAFSQMSDTEIAAAYSYIFDYFLKGTKPAATDPLLAEINAISAKYNIFT